MKIDKLVYLLLQLVPHAFFALIGRAMEDAKNYVFKSVEVKEIAFRFDGVLSPLLPNDITYFVEAQSQLDEQFYARFFAEIFIYLKQYGVTNWKAVVIYPSRSVEQKNLDGYRELLESGRVVRIYLNELPDFESASKETSLFKLLIEPEKTAPAVARKLIRNATPVEINLIEQIIVYKFVKITREEIKDMLDIEKDLKDLFKETQFYKEIVEESKLTTVPLLRELGLSDEQIALRLELPLELVKAVPQS